MIIAPTELSVDEGWNVDGGQVAIAVFRPINRVRFKFDCQTLIVLR
jgi:hypothetical protein